METRVIIPLLGAAALAFACGPWSNREQSVAAAPTVHHSRHNARVASSLDVTVGRRINFALNVTNNTDKMVELRFPSGQTHDFMVLDSAGKVVWRWSTGRMFTQALQNKTVHSDETVTFEDAWDGVHRRGAYTAVARLISENHPVERRVAFVVR